MNVIKKYYFLIFCVVSFILPDYLVLSLKNPRFFDETYVFVVAKLFTLAWILFFIVLCACILPKHAGRILYIIINTAFLILAICEYVYFKIFEQFFWLKSIMLAGEGADYLGYAMQHVDAFLLIVTILCIISIVIASIGWRGPIICGKWWYLVILIPVVMLSSLHLYMQPQLHNEKTDTWDSWRKPRVVYSHFNDINKSIETTGLYQFTYLNLHTAVFRTESRDVDDLLRAEEFLESKGELPVNDYTGLFRGKNVIAVMMESIDTWMIDKKYTPTLYKMINEGIAFTNYNAPFFGVGFTFSSEFAFNTGHFTPVAAISASNFSKNSFPYSFANLFKEAGYITNSFHFNSPEFYNRGIMHKSFGYEKYNCVTDFGIDEESAQLDSNMLLNDELYAKMTQNTPFCNFIITYSAHLPYVVDDSKLSLAKEYYPDLIDENMHPEKNNALILAHDTDTFFKTLLKRLEEDGLLDDTIIIGYTDHFAYGVSDQELMLNEWKKDLSYRVPAFIYAKGMRGTKIDKPMMTIDWLPTIVNLFGLNRDGRYIGNDILDPDNPGFVYFETWDWMDENGYHKRSDEVYTGEEKIYIDKQNERVKNSIEVNDTVVIGDYYGKKLKKD